MGIKHIVRTGGTHRPTIEQMFMEFIEEKKSLGLSPYSLQNYQNSFRRWHAFVAGMGFSLTIDSVTKEHYSAFSNHLIAEDMNRTSINHYLNDVRTFLYWSMERNLFAPFKCARVMAQETFKIALNDEEKRALLAHPKEGDSFSIWRTWAIIAFVLATGARESTVCAMKMGDVDFQHAEIVFNRTKNKRVLVLPLSPALRGILREYVNVWRTTSKPDDWLFPSIGDEYLTPDALWQMNRKYAHARGVYKTSVHLLRHTFSLDYIRNSGSVVKLKEILSHNRLDTTMRYVRLLNSDIKEDYSDYCSLDVLMRKSRRTHKVVRG